MPEPILPRARIEELALEAYESHQSRDEANPYPLGSAAAIHFDMHFNELALRDAQEGVMV